MIERQEVVTRLFDDTSRHYDRVTAWMCFGTGARYRRDALRRSGVGAGSRVLDVACGTGQVAAEALRLVGPDGVVVGVDPSRGMRRVAEARGIRTLEGAAERLPVPDGAFDTVVMGYALRHVADLVGAFREMRRALRAGGTVLILEITPPEGRVTRALLRLYLKGIVPPASLLLTADRRAMELMRYYWETIERSVGPPAILDAMRRAELDNPQRHRTLGVFSEYTAIKPLA